MNEPSSIQNSPQPAIADPEHPPRITRSSEWIAHFESNAARQRPIPWELGAAVTAAELSVISDSLRAWQLGETSDGSHLMEAARHDAVSIGFQKLMFAGVTLAIWAGHRRALRAGGYDFARFWRTGWRKMNRAWRAMSPEGYRFAGHPLQGPSIVESDVPGIAMTEDFQPQMNRINANGRTEWT